MANGISCTYSYTNSYDSSNHASVLTRMYGSVWPKVLLPCALNVALVCTVIYLKEERGIDLTYSDRGHVYASTIVSFLLVTRSSIAYSRFMEARGGLAVCMKSCRELMQHAVTFTRYQHEERSKKWRFDLARKTIALLRFVVSVLELGSCLDPNGGGMHAWRIPALTYREKSALMEAVGEDNERSPMILTMFIRSTIASHVEFLETPLHVQQELKLYSSVSDFVEGYHQLITLVDTPFPFPLVQMNRCFLIVWVFSLPLVLYRDGMGKMSTILAIFFMTYAFVGLEFVCIELDDPYGDDPNDIDVLGKAQAIFEDVYNCIHDIDGPETSLRLRAYFSVQEMHDMDEPSSIRSIWHATAGEGTNTSETASLISTNPFSELEQCQNSMRQSDRFRHKRLPTEYALRLSMPKSPDAGDDKSKIMQHVTDMPALPKHLALANL